MHGMQPWSARLPRAWARLGGVAAAPQVAAWPVVLMSILISGAGGGCRRSGSLRLCLHARLAWLASQLPHAACEGALVDTTDCPCTLAAVGLALPHTPIGRAEGFTTLPPSFYAWVAATVVGYALTVQLAKMLYMRRFRSWL